MRGPGPVILELSQPKKVGRLLRPRLTIVFWFGMEGKAVPFWTVGFMERA